MVVPVSRLALWALLATVAPAVAAEDPPELELLMFLGEFTDQNGDWDAPEVDQESIAPIEEAQESAE